MPSSPYLFTGVSPNVYVEPLLVVAGGGGGGDNRYNTTPGSYGNAVNGSTNTGFVSFLSGGVGTIYSRNGQTGYGGFGGGVANDDLPGFGGGYINGASGTTAYSYCENAIERKDGENEDQGKVIIHFKKYVRTAKTFVVNTPGSDTLNMPTDLMSGDTITINNTGTRHIGTFVRYTIPTDITVQIEGWGASGSAGNVATTSNQVEPGKGAYIKTNEISLTAGTELFILVGQKGGLDPSVYAGDGSGRRRWRRNLHI